MSSFYLHIPKVATVLKWCAAGRLFKDSTKVGRTAETAFFADLRDGGIGGFQFSFGKDDPCVKNIFHHCLPCVIFELPAEMVLTRIDSPANSINIQGISNILVDKLDRFAYIAVASGCTLRGVNF